MEVSEPGSACDESITLSISIEAMKKSMFIGIIIGVFAAAIYFFETGEKDPNVENNEAPSHVKG